jgi:hypothetical protein
MRCDQHVPTLPSACPSVLLQTSADNPPQRSSRQGNSTRAHRRPTFPEATPRPAPPGRRNHDAGSRRLGSRAAAESGSANTSRVSSSRWPDPPTHSGCRELRIDIEPERSLGSSDRSLASSELVVSTATRRSAAAARAPPPDTGGAATPTAPHATPRWRRPAAVARAAVRAECHDHALCAPTRYVSMTGSGRPVAFATSRRSRARLRDGAVLIARPSNCSANSAPTER